MEKKNLFARSLQAQLVLGVGLCLLVVGAAIIAYAAFISNASAVESARQNAIDQSISQSTAIQANVEVALGAARTLAQSLSAIKVKDQPISLTRDQVNGMLRKVLQDTPSSSVLTPYGSRTPLMAWIKILWEKKATIRPAGLSPIGAGVGPAAVSAWTL
jgi:hypothetical protein